MGLGRTSTQDTLRHHLTTTWTWYRYHSSKFPTTESHKQRPTKLTPELHLYKPVLVLHKERTIDTVILIEVTPQQYQQISHFYIVHNNELGPHQKRGSNRPPKVIPSLLLLRATSSAVGSLPEATEKSKSGWIGAAKTGQQQNHFLLSLFEFGLKAQAIRKSSVARNCKTRPKPDPAGKVWLGKDRPALIVNRRLPPIPNLSCLVSPVGT